MNSPSEEIKSRLDIIDIIGSYLRVQKAGINYRALCPFHKEKTPSFFISPTRQIWRCFGCSEGGDIFTFIMKIEGIEFAEALQVLAGKAGVQLTREDPKVRSLRQKLYDINEEAAQFFEENLSKKGVGEETRTYLEKRGLNKLSVKNFRVGYASSEWQALFGHLTALGYVLDDIEKTGLIIQKDSRYYDRFRDRVMFPIRDLNGRVAGFTGRLLHETEGADQAPSTGSGQAKYMNSPETPIFAKGSILYGLESAKLPIRKEDRCILVEGNVDAILSHQIGAVHTVATSGTALTEEHLRKIKRYTSNIILAFDRDRAGDDATKRGIALAQFLGFSIRIALTPEGKDPADYIQKYGESWHEVLGQAVSVYTFYFQSVFSQFDRKDPDDKKRISQILLPILKNIPNRVEQAHWVGELARELTVKEDLLFEELEKTAPLSTDSAFLRKEANEPKAALEKRTRKEILEERLLVTLFANPAKREHLNKEEENFLSSPTTRFFEYLPRRDEGEHKEIPAEMEGHLSHILFSLEVEKEREVNLEEEFELVRRELRFLALRERMDSITLSLREAERKEDDGKVSALLEEFQTISQKLHSINSFS